MTNIYISNARKAAQLSLQGRRELIGFGVSKTRLGICSVYKWQEITLFVLQHNPNFKKKAFYLWSSHYFMETSSHRGADRGALRSGTKP